MIRLIQNSSPAWTTLGVAWTNWTDPWTNGVMMRLNENSSPAWTKGAQLGLVGQEAPEGKTRFGKPPRLKQGLGYGLSGT